MYVHLIVLYKRVFVVRFKVCLLNIYNNIHDFFGEFFYYFSYTLKQICF